MADVLVLEWLDEFESLTESEIHTYSTEQEHNHEIMIALYNVLSEPQKYKSDHLVDGICQQLLNFYRSGESHLRRFTVQFLPALVFLHLADKSYSAVQTLLVSLYNLEVIDTKGQPRTLSFRIPSIAQSSIYHDSSILEPAFIAENSLRRWEECNTKLVSWGPLPQVECINAQNRQRLATALIFIYNQQLANVMSQGVEHTCRGISRLVTQGFSNNSDSSRSSIASDVSNQHNFLRRIPVSSPLLVELLHVIYHASERCAAVAMQALHDIVQRAGYESYAEVLLAGNAIKSLLHNFPAVSVASRPSQTHSVSKSMITNASFRTKKLPDDIPIQDPDHPNVPPQPETALDSITEEQEEGERAARAAKGGPSGALKHLPKIPGIGKKHKTKESPIELAVSGDLVVGDGIAGDQNRSVHVSAV